MATEAAAVAPQDDDAHQEWNSGANDRHSELLDVDEEALRLAKEEEAAAAGASAEGVEPQPGAPPASPAAAPAAPASAAPPASPRMVPVERLNQETKKGQQAADAAYWRGKAEALEAVVKGGGAPAAGANETPPKTPQDQIKDLRAGQQELARKYRDGEITDIVEFEKQRGEMDDQIADLRQTAAAPAAPAASPLSDGWLQEQTPKLFEEFPVLTVDPNGQAYVSLPELQNLERIAVGEMASEGLGHDPGNPRSVHEVRVRVGELAEQLYAYRLPPELQPGAYQPGNRQPATRQPTPTSQPAAGARTASPGVTPGQRLAKADLASRASPDISRTGQPATARGITEAQLQAMSDEDVEALPAETRQAIRDGKYFDGSH